MSDEKQIVGGGAKKLLYTAKTVKKVGLRKSGKALTSKNTCKACGLGMGGQRGGMVNEMDEFPSVCNKSVQAQSTDIQPEITASEWRRPLKELRAYSDHQLEHLGRLNQPLVKRSGADRFHAIEWSDVINEIAEAFKSTAAERSFFYSSGRSSNEAGFVLQLLARMYGTNNVNNCSYYCHQATSVGLESTLGISTASIELEDLQSTDLLFLIGANPASNHPRFIHQLKKIRDRGGQVIVINPAREPGLVKFAVPKSPSSLIVGGTDIASVYLQPKIGSDQFLLYGICKALIEEQQQDEHFIRSATEGFDQFKNDLASLEWSLICEQSGVDHAVIIDVAHRYASAENVVFAWGMGMTHHLNGVNNIEAIANLCLMRGQIGKPGAGVLPLRGHSNVQGIGTVGVKPYLPEDVFAHIEEYLGVALPRAAGMDTLACLEAADRGDIDLALVMGGNLFQASPDARWAEQALNKIGLKVFLTTTLNRGHLSGIDLGDTIILPVTARDEEWEPTTQESMFNYVRMSDGGIKRFQEARPETWILCRIAEQLFPNGPVDFKTFAQHSNIRAAIAASVPGLEQLVELDAGAEEFTIPERLLHQSVFPTASGRARFVRVTLPETKHTDDYPWMLASIRSEGQFNSIVYEEQDSYRGTSSRWCILMNPDDMKSLSLEPGNTVNVRSEQGEMQGLNVVAFDVTRGCVLAYYPEANVLTSRDRDPLSKTPAFKSVPVSIERVAIT